MKDREGRPAFCETVRQRKDGVWRSGLSGEVSVEKRRGFRAGGAPQPEARVQDPQDGGRKAHPRRVSRAH